MDDVIAALKRIELFARLPEEVLAELASKMKEHDLEEGQVLFQKGDPGDALYLIRSGRAKVVLADAYGRETVLNECGPGNAIGDVSLVDQEERSATVVAISPLKTLRLDENDFLDVMAGQSLELLHAMRELASQMRLQKAVSDLKKLELFEGLPDEAVARLVPRLERRTLREGEVLFREGDRGDTLYIIKTGWVKIVRYNERGEELELNQNGPGDVVGEMALIDQAPRSATVIALSPVEMVQLKYEDFIDVITENPPLALELIRTLSSRLRFANAYLGQTIEWSRHITEGNYKAVIEDVQNSQSAIAGAQLSDEERAKKLLSAFYTMTEGVKAREDNLKQQLYQLTIQIDEAKRRQEFDELTQSTFFSELKAAAKKLREQREAEED
jgi:CRP-like cAMP-binding protein